MSDIHLTERIGTTRVYRCCFHIPIPDQQNNQGVNYRDAIVWDRSPATQMPIGNLPGQITQAEADQVASGALVEFWTDVDTDPNRNENPPPNYVQNTLDAAYKDAKTRIQEEVQVEYKHYGYTQEEAP